MRAGGPDIRFSTRPPCEGLEGIGCHPPPAEARGVHLQATLALNGEDLLLGVLRCTYKKKKETKTPQWIDAWTRRPRRCHARRACFA